MASQHVIAQTAIQHVIAVLTHQPVVAKTTDSLEVETDAASAGVARIVLLTPYPATFDIASIGGATPDAASTYATNDSLVIGFDPPLKESVQLTIPFQTRMLSANHDFRGLSGQIAGGIVKVGQEILVLPSGQKSRVKEIWTYDGSLEEAFCPQSVTLVLENDLDVSRGDMVVGLDPLPGHSSDLAARVCWMNQQPLKSGKKYYLKHGAQTVQVMVSSLESRIDIRTYEPQPDPVELAMNDIGEVRLRTAKPLVYDGYTTNRLTGSFVLVEQGSNATVAAGMLQPPIEQYKPEYTDFSI